MRTRLSLAEVMAIDGPADAPARLDCRTRAAAGDAAAFEELVGLHERPVLRTALRILGRLEDAQDAAQEVFLRLHKHLPRLDKARDLSPWLYRVTVNVCNDFYRKKPRGRMVPMEDAEREPVLQTGADERLILAEAIKALPARERAAIVLRDIEGLSTREVAEAMGTSEVTVRSHVCRARVKIVNFMRRTT